MQLQRARVRDHMTAAAGDLYNTLDVDFIMFLCVYVCMFLYLYFFIPFPPLRLFSVMIDADLVMICRN